MTELTMPTKRSSLISTVFNEKTRSGFYLGRESSLCVVVVTAALCYQNFVIFNPIDEAIFFIDSSAEVTLQVSLKGLRVTDSVHCTIPVDILDEGIDALQGFLILRLPVQVGIGNKLVPQITGKNGVIPILME